MCVISALRSHTVLGSAVLRRVGRADKSEAWTIEMRDFWNHVVSYQVVFGSVVSRGRMRGGE